MAIVNKEPTGGVGLYLLLEILDPYESCPATSSQVYCFKKKKGVWIISSRSLYFSISTGFDR
jgi:hypothetical protein